jgi:cytochrome c biogenesis protein CcdA
LARLAKELSHNHRGEAIKLLGANAQTTTPGRLIAAVGVVGLLVFAFVAGVLQGPGANETVGSVLGVQSTSTTWVSDFGDLLPFGFAFVAGMVAAVNPCGFVMLPAYLTIYLRDASDVEEEAGWSGTVRHGLKAIYVSLAMGLGFLALFGSAGLLVSASQELVKDALPWIGFMLGILMAILGAYILIGGKIYTGFAQQLADRVGDPRVSSLGGYFLFGISYALASLSCTLPIFLSVVTSSFGRDGLASGLVQFAAYAGGMAFLIMIVTIGIALFKSTVLNPLRRSMRYVEQLSAVILALVGAYLVFYWLTEGDLSTYFGAS